MKIEDDFLEQENFEMLQAIIMGDNFPWFYNDNIVGKDDILRFQFTHTFFIDCNNNSENFSLLYPILKKIQPISIWRIKANLRTKRTDIIEPEFHVDMMNLSEEKLKQWTTSIFYMNTNNGYTEFEDGTKVESVANRMVTFPADMRHNGVSCTDEKTRVVINFNYFKGD